MIDSVSYPVGSIGEASQVFTAENTRQKSPIAQQINDLNSNLTELSALMYNFETRIGSALAEVPIANDGGERVGDDVDMRSPLHAALSSLNFEAVRIRRHLSSLLDRLEM